MFRSTRLAWIILAVFLLADALLLLSVLTAPLSLDPAFLPTAEYLDQHPQPIPDFIAEYSQNIEPCLSIENSIYVAVNQRPFARVGTSAGALGQYLFENYSVKIDNQPVKTDAAQLTTLLCEDGELGDPNAKCFGGSMGVCVDTSLANPGLHLAEITVTDLDGIPHSFSWAFRIG
jgi:hypothetical protein